MFNIEEKNFYLKDYDITISNYLTLAQIQQIVNSSKQFDTWAERETNIDMMVLYYATNIPKDDIEKIGHDKLLKSGLINSVKSNIININDVYKALEWTQSLEKSLTQILKYINNLYKENNKNVKKSN